MNFDKYHTQKLGTVRVFARDGDRVYYWDSNWTPCVIPRRLFEAEVI